MSTFAVDSQRLFEIYSITEEAQAENERLRAQVKELTDQLASDERFVTVEAEKAELREKVKRQANEITHMRLALERANPWIRVWKNHARIYFKACLESDRDNKELRGRLEKVKAASNAATVNLHSALDYRITQCGKLQVENKRLKGFVREVYADICKAYLAGRPLEPYQYERDMRELGIEVCDESE